METSKEALHAIFDKMEIGICLHDEDGNILSANRRMLEIIGGSARDAGKTSIQKLFAGGQIVEKLPILWDQVLAGERRMFEWISPKSGGVAEVALTSINLNGAPAILMTVTDISKYKEIEKELQQQATTDETTGVHNKTYFVAAGEEELRRANRYNRQMSLLVLEVDGIKEITETHGELVADQINKTMTDACLKALRSSDILGRLGKTEFAAILAESDQRAAMEAAERLRKSLAHSKAPTDVGQVDFTVSIGAASLGYEPVEFKRLLKKAERALYEAKTTGRDQVVFL